MINQHKQLASFSRVTAVFFIILGLLFFIRQKPEFLLCFVAGIFFLAAGMIRPLLLKWPYMICQSLVNMLSWMVTRIILGAMFYIILMPVGLALRLFGHDPLCKKPDKKARSYWKPEEKSFFKKSDYERMY